MNAPCRRKTTNPAEFDIDDAAGTQANRSQRLFFGVNAFVEADGRYELVLEFDMRKKIVPPKRLLDHHEIEVIELLKKRSVSERVG